MNDLAGEALSLLYFRRSWMDFAKNRGGEKKNRLLIKTVKREKGQTHRKCRRRRRRTNLSEKRTNLTSKGVIKTPWVMYPLLSAFAEQNASLRALIAACLVLESINTSNSSHIRNGEGSREHSAMNKATLINERSPPERDPKSPWTRDAADFACLVRLTVISSLPGTVISRSPLISLCGATTLTLPFNWLGKKEFIYKSMGHER